SLRTTIATAQDGRADGPHAMDQLRQRLHGKIVDELRATVDLNEDAEVRRDIEHLFGRFLGEEDLVLNRNERAKLLSQVMAEILGYGPIQELINDDSVSEIMVNG